ncbi:uncharacterized protein LOC116107390 [Pistacia vera]|uniref:uncharacterized protein LOC116107390 n=1 Tax=Pistacia vera TaxID=55513 RepID=UPI00126361D7|nr:uncharacterized protein LOC116107390 [Pistacia vera]
MEDYRRKFEVLFAPLRDKKEDTLWAAFLNELRPEIKAEVRPSMWGQTVPVILINEEGTQDEMNNSGGELSESVVEQLQNDAKLSISSVVGMTPFKALYGRDPPSILKFFNHGLTVDEVNCQLQARNVILAKLQENLLKAQGCMKSYADTKRGEVQLEVGDSVYLKLQPYCLRSLAHRYNEKLSPQFYGPFEVKEMIGTVAYCLNLPPTARIHDVFHVSQLKKTKYPPPTAQPFPATLDEDLVLKVEPEEVLRMRKLLNGTLEVLIKWKGLPNYENTWEEFTSIDLQFPLFHLWDKVALLGEGNDGTPLVHVFSRKNKRVNRGWGQDLPSRGQS